MTNLAPAALPKAVPSDDDRKQAQWKVLTDKFDEVCMRKHEWQYDTDYLPLYRFQQVTRICDIWTEWSTVAWTQWFSACQESQ
jgi:hypothetical protein